VPLALLLEAEAVVDGAGDLPQSTFELLHLFSSVTLDTRSNLSGHIRLIQYHNIIVHMGRDLDHDLLSTKVEKSLSTSTYFQGEEMNAVLRPAKNDLETDEPTLPFGG
jgi:hypothetical protein